MDFHCLTLTFPGIPQVSCAFSLGRTLSNDPPQHWYNMSFDVGDDPQEVVNNRTLFAQQTGVRKWSEMQQVHGTEIHKNPPHHSPESSGTLQGDAQHTDTSGQGLIIKSADCQPILLTDTKARAVCAVHCGWRGNRHAFPQMAVQSMCTTYDLKPENILAIRGPSLGPSRSEFIHFDTEWGQDFLPYYDSSTRCMNLWTLTRDQLLEAGLVKEHLFSLDFCTYNNPRILFSHRRYSKSGRHMAMIWKNN